MKDKAMLVRSWKGAINNLYFDYRVGFKICFIISAAILLAIFLSNVLMTAFGAHVSGSSNGGGMNITAMTAIITMGICAIEFTSKKNLESKFFFPLNRKIYSLANFIMMIFASFFFTTISLTLTAVEMLIGNLITINSGELFFISNFSWQNYLGGTVLLFLYLIVIGSLVYCAFMFLRKQLILSLIVLGIVILLPVFNTAFVSTYKNVLTFFTYDKTMVMLSIKLLVLTLFLHGLAYLPFSKMEVVK